MLVGWTRFVGGRFRDPLVGRDVLIGVTCGAALALLNLATTVVPVKLGHPEPPHTTEFGPLFGLRGTILTLLGCVNAGMQNMLITTFEFAGFRALFERLTQGLLRSMSSRARDAVFLMLAIATIAIISAVSNNNTLLNTLYQSISIALVINVLIRIGIFSATVMFVSNYVLLRFPFTFDTNALYAASTWTALLLLLGAAAIGYWMAANPAVDRPRAFLTAARS